MPTQTRWAIFSLLIALMGLTSLLPAPSRAVQATQEPTLEPTSEPTAETTEEPSALSTTRPVILLLPATDPSDDSVTVLGQRWTEGEQVVINLLSGDNLRYAVAVTTVSEDGDFEVSFSLPSFFDGEQTIPVLAETFDSDASARAMYTVRDAAPRGMVSVDRLNVRTGPGLVYRRVGQVTGDQIVAITGRNGDWWRIEYSHAAGDFGWVSGDFVDTINTDDVPFIIAPPTPSPTPAPTRIPTPTEPQMVCNPGQWTGCGGVNGLSCPPEYVAQCQENGQWGQCLWDPGSCEGFVPPNSFISSGDDDEDDFTDDNITREDVQDWLEGRRPTPDPDDEDDNTDEDDDE